ncbi:hypothetical protein BV898_03010 [Hypsibius exemplaris]|uniref:C-type lectin domain-containing protein n=1 Tax=Hypsibius exemplaris TaxID=2072580 RepID=A0A1W0X6F9_HYPEX|nr:hypothetical protein BV898_03010 [Hypsibius exemplaris]
MTNLLQLLFVCAVLFGARNASRCPGREWVARAGTEDCYFIYVVNNDPFTPGAEAQTFEGAIEECIIRGGNIFTADDDEELDYVKSRLSSELEQYWFGLSFRLETNTWSWWDGVSQRPFNQNDFPNLTPWVSNANGNGSRTGGVLAFEYPANVVQFQPKSYDEKVGFICKGRFNGRPLCKTEDGWTFDSDRCYLHVPEPHHFGIAQEYCFKEGGVVATINSERENMRMKMWLLKHSNRVAWLGIKITNKTANTAAGDVKWEDGTLITDTAINHWQTDGLDLPNYIRQLDNGHDYCGEIQAMIANNNDWSLQSNCHSRSLPFACESEKTFCPYGWSEHSDPDSGARTCYRRVPEPKSWDEAVRSCQSLGAKLVEIRDALTHRVVRDIILTEESFSASIPKMSYWIGARNYKNAQRRFQWQDGTSLTFTDWKNGVQPEVPNQPITVGGPPEPVDYCVLMDGLSTIPQQGIPRGSWDAQLCTEELPYVCAADAAADISIPDTIMPDITCNAPFERFHDGCYMYNETALNREAAQAHCAAQGSYLVTINTVGENQHILGLLKSDAWIGLKATSLNPSTGAGRWPWLYQQANGAPFNGGSILR